MATRVMFPVPPQRHLALPEPGLERLVAPSAGHKEWTPLVAAGKDGDTQKPFLRQPLPLVWRGHGVTQGSVSFAILASPGDCIPLASHSSWVR